MDCSLPGSSVQGIFLARVLEWVAIAFSIGNVKYHTIALISHASKVMLKILQARLQQYMKVKSESEVAQSCPTLSDPMDCSLPGSSTHGIFQARVLEWDAIAFSYVAIHTAI